MATDAIPGLHAQIYYWNGSSYTEIAEVTNIGWDGPTREVIEIANLNTVDEYMNKIQGVLNANNITCSINYTGAQWATLIDHLETRGNKFYRITLPDGFGIEWEGFLSEVPLDIPSDAQMAGEVVFSIDGRADLLSSGESSGA